MRRAWNRRVVSIVLSAGFGLLISMSCENDKPSWYVPTPTPTPTPVPAPVVPVDIVKKKWAFLFYDDADFFEGFDPFKNYFSAEMAASPNLHVLVMRDPRGGMPAAIWSIDENHTALSLAEWPEINMGAASTVQTFARFAKAYFPAERYVVAFYDHGYGWAGCCSDDSHNDMLSMEEIRLGLMELPRVDAVLFTAPCMMAALESVYQLRDLADIYVGAEGGSGYVRWHDGPLLWLQRTLNETPEISALDLGRGLVQQIGDFAQINTTYADPENLTMSAVQPGRMRDLNGAFNLLIQELRAQGVRTTSDFDAIATDVRSFDGEYVVDFNDLLEHLANVDNSSRVRDRIAAVQAALDRAVVAERHGNLHPNSHGLSIVFPRASNLKLPAQYGDFNYHLDFARDSLWDELLREDEAVRPDARFAPWPVSPPTNGFYPPVLIRQKLSELGIRRR